MEDELRRFYQKYGKDGVVTYNEARKWVSEQDHTRRLTALSLYLSGEFATALSKIEPHFRKFLTEVIGKESTFFGISVDVEKLLNRPWGVDELYWLDRLEADVNLWKAYIANDIKRAMHQGSTIEELMKKLDKRFQNINTIMERLGITESTAIGSMARREIFKELGVTKYRFYTKADERTCELCGSIHGLTFPISAYEVGFNASPLHPRCRCWEVPILD